MTTLLLRLAGPMQSWGDSSRFTQRRTRAEPTKSGVIGLLAAAGGRRRSDPIEDLAQLRFGVRVDQPGQLMRDFQTAHHQDSGKAMPLSVRYYLSDAIFLAGVEGPAGLLETLAETVQHPAFPLYLGRRSCPPSRPVFGGLKDCGLDGALRNAPWEASLWHRRQLGKSCRLELLLDATSPAETDDTVRDAPVSFDPRLRRYEWRDVHRANPVEISNPDGITGMNFMDAVEGR